VDEDNDNPRDGEEGGEADCGTDEREGLGPFHMQMVEGFLEPTP